VTGKTLSLSDIFSLASAIVIVGTAVLGAIGGAVKLYRQTIGSRLDLAARINQLGAGVTVRYVEERFGAPVFARAFPRPVPGTSQPGEAAPKLRELTYDGKHAWIQVIADEHDAVARFSVTVTDPRFRFSTRYLTNHQLTIRLGRSTFADIPDRDPSGRSLRIGAHNFEYAEAYWGANPGNYQWFVLSYNDSGTGTIDVASAMQERILGHQAGVLRPDAKQQFPLNLEPLHAGQFRAGTVINTPDSPRPVT
jgi:hypothetical protein